jgi:hypothetical protein
MGKVEVATGGLCYAFAVKKALANDGNSFTYVTPLI